MKRLVITVVTALAVAGCGDTESSTDGAATELSTDAACRESREPVEDAMAQGDVTRAAEVLRDVAERGNEDVQRVFGDAADAADYIAENGNEDGAPQWATIAFNALDSMCEPSPGD